MWPEFTAGTIRLFLNIFVKHPIEGHESKFFSGKTVFLVQAFEEKCNFRNLRQKVENLNLLL